MQGRWTGCLQVAAVIAGAFAILIGFLFLANPGPGNPLLNALGALGGGGGQPGGQTSAGALNVALTQLGDNFIDGGTAMTSVGGAFSLSGQQIQADTLRSYIQGGMAWLGFGALAGGTGAAEILITLNEGGQDTVTVAQGDLAAIGQDDDCQWNIEVTESSVSGTISCASVEVLRNTTAPAGTASIQLQFSTILTPMDEGDAEPTGDGG